MPPTADAARLLARLGARPLVVEAVTVIVDDVVEPTYPGGRRPSATITLAGCGVSGHGEHVAWSRPEHEALVEMLGPVPRGSTTVAAWARALRRHVAAPYARAALEAAAIDLALRQAGETFFALTDVPPRPVRYVVSFDRRPDPAAEVARQRRAAPDLEFKIDADPAWDDATWRALAAAGGVAIVDFKGRGDAAVHARALHALPTALLEDPGPGPRTDEFLARTSLDATIRSAADVDALPALPALPAAVNVKPARLGGVLEALAAVAACQRRRIPVYLGGMFEVGVGRRQLQVLAALFAPDGPNDVAPLGVRPERPARVPVAAHPGFGAA